MELLMKKLVNLHLEYLFNKINIFVFSICTLIFSLANASNLVDVYTTTSYTNKSEIYLEGSLILLEVFSVILSCFIFSFNFLKEKDEYRYLFVKNEDERKEFLFKKIIASFLFLLLFESLNLFILLVIGYIGIDNFNIDSIFCFRIVCIFVQLFYFGLFSLLLIKTFDNLFIVMLPIIGKFMALYLIDSKNNLAKVFLFWFPSSSNNNLSKVLLVIVEIIVLFIVVTYIEINKDY